MQTLQTDFSATNKETNLNFGIDRWRDADDISAVRLSSSSPSNPMLFTPILYPPSVCAFYQVKKQKKSL